MTPTPQVDRVRAFADLQAEAAWLEALQRDTDVGAPAVVRTRYGEAVLPMRGPGVPDVWHATLMTWVDGRLLAHHLGEANLARLGELFARLHLHGQAWTPPAGFSERRFEAFLSRGEPDALFEGGAIDGLRNDDRRAFLRARGWVEGAYASLDRGDLRVIHCDLWHANVKLDRERLLWKANWVARFQPASFGAMGAAQARVFRGFEEDGGLRLPA